MARKLSWTFVASRFQFLPFTTLQVGKLFLTYGISASNDFYKNTAAHARVCLDPTIFLTAKETFFCVYFFRPKFIAFFCID